MKKIKLNYFFTPAYTLPESTNFCRVGIIPYFKDEDGLPHLFLMLDSKFKELTDCGGLPKAGENWISTSIRETEEESRNFFKFTYEEILNEGNVFWREDNRIAIVFMNVSNKIPNKLYASELCYKYRLDYLNGIYCKDKRHNLENSDMFFYSIEDLIVIIRQYNKIYTPVRMLLIKFIRTNVYKVLI